MHGFMRGEQCGRKPGRGRRELAATDEPRSPAASRTLTAYECVMAQIEDALGTGSALQRGPCSDALVWLRYGFRDRRIKGR